MSVACTEDESMIVALLSYFFRVSRSCDAKPKFPFMKSSVFSGRFTPARLKTKSASLQYSSSCSFVESISYSYISSTEIFGLVRFLLSLIFFRLFTRAVPTMPFAPVTNIFIFSRSLLIFSPDHFVDYINISLNDPYDFH